MEGGSSMASLITAIGTAFTTVSSDFFSILSTALPIALGILGAGIAIRLGVKYFKQIAG